LAQVGPVPERIAEGVWLKFTRWSRGRLADSHLQGPNTLTIHQLDHLLSLVRPDYRPSRQTGWIGCPVV
jgi:hypothetical protein